MRQSVFKDTATLWRVTGSNGQGGYTFAKPVIIKVRWEDRQQTFLSTDGRELVSNAVIYADRQLVVDDYIARGDYLPYLNPVTDLSTKVAWQIRQYMRTTNLRASMAVHTAFT